MKFERRFDLLNAMTRLLGETLITRHQNRQIKLPELIMPIPLHPKRLRERGFNQSQLIAKQLSLSLNIPWQSSSISRIKNTPHQIGLSAADRRKNLKQAFQIKQDLPTHIALVDDVYTTGTTINEACTQCLKHGAKTIDVWCLAKT